MLRSDPPTKLTGSEASSSDQRKIGKKSIRPEQENLLLYSDLNPFGSLELDALEGTADTLHCLISPRANTSPPRPPKQSPEPLTKQRSFEKIPTHDESQPEKGSKPSQAHPFKPS